MSKGELTTWRKLILDAMEANGESWLDVMSEAVGVGDSLDDSFDNGYGGEEGCSFTVWTEDYVYFPICYDGAEWCGSAPRNPNDVALSHQGG
jgi:hypothetical protein